MKKETLKYFYASYIENGNECVDMMLYRLAELKASKNWSSKTLKSISVDCLLNTNQQKFARTKQNLMITLSNNKSIKY